MGGAVGGEGHEILHTPLVYVSSLCEGECRSPRSKKIDGGEVVFEFMGYFLFSFPLLSCGYGLHQLSAQANLLHLAKADDQPVDDDRRKCLDQKYT